MTRITKLYRLAPLSPTSEYKYLVALEYDNIFFLIIFKIFFLSPCRRDASAVSYIIDKLLIWSRPSTTQNKLDLEIPRIWVKKHLPHRRNVITGDVESKGTLSSETGYYRNTCQFFIATSERVKIALHPAQLYWEHFHFHPVVSRGPRGTTPQSREVDGSARWRVWTGETTAW